MIFITDSDIAVLIRTENLTQITGADSTMLDHAELIAIEEISGYLRGRYDTAAVFAATGTDRNPQVVTYTIDCMLYHLLSRITPRNIPQIRIDRYDVVLAWLDKVNEGTLIPNLPEYTGNPTGSNEDAAQNFRFGSNDKFNHQY